MNIRAQRVLLSTAVRSATTVSPQQNDRSSKTLRVYFNVQVVSGTGGLTLQLLGYDKETGSSVVLFQDASGITATGIYLFEIAPAIAAGGSNRRGLLEAYLPVVWAINIVHGDGSNYTYSVSAETTS